MNDHKHLNDALKKIKNNNKNKLPYRPSGYFSACLHLGQRQASVATVNRLLLNSQPLTTSCSILLKQPPQGPATLLSRRHVETLPPPPPPCPLPRPWKHSESPDTAFILESLTEYLKVPRQGQNLTCLSSLQLLLLN